MSDLLCNKGVKQETMFCCGRFESFLQYQFCPFFPDDSSASTLSGFATPSSSPGSSGNCVAPVRVAGRRDLASPRNAGGPMQESPRGGEGACTPGGGRMAPMHPTHALPCRPYRALASSWATRPGIHIPGYSLPSPTGLRPPLLQTSLNTPVMPQKTHYSSGQDYPSHRKAGIAVLLQSPDAPVQFEPRSQGHKGFYCLYWGIEKWPSDCMHGESGSFARILQTGTTSK